MSTLRDYFGLAELSDSYLDAALAGSKVTASLVVGPAGEAQDELGGSKQLGGETDLIWLRALRAKADAVITGGNTYRTENYRMPKSADLVVFSRNQLLAPEGFADSPRFRLLEPETSILDSIAMLKLDYPRIHLEFGPKTLLPIISSLGVGAWVSSQFEQGIKRFCEGANLQAIHAFQYRDLHIAYCR